jgi:hypothetical protein
MMSICTRRTRDITPKKRDPFSGIYSVLCGLCIARGRRVVLGIMRPPASLVFRCLPTRRCGVDLALKVPATGNRARRLGSLNLTKADYESTL